MQSRQLIALAVILAVAAAGIGAAYAYTAELQNDSNDAAGMYLAIDVTGSATVDKSKNYQSTFDADKLRFNTVTAWGTLPEAIAESQVITYTPLNGNVEASEIPKLDYMKGVQLGITLEMTIDSTQMASSNYYSFTVETEDLGLVDSMDILSEVGAFVLYYEVNGVPNYHAMKEDTFEMFICPDRTDDTEVVVELYAVQVKSSEFIDNKDLSFSDISFTFTAKVDETNYVFANSHALTVSTTNNAASPAKEDVDYVRIFTVPAATTDEPILVASAPSRTAGAGVYGYELPAGKYSVEAVKENRSFYSADAATVDMTSDSKTVAFAEQAPTTATIRTLPNTLTYVKGTTNFDFTGMTVTLAFANDVSLIVSDIALFSAPNGWSSTVSPPNPGYTTLSMKIKNGDAALTERTADVNVVITNYLTSIAITTDPSKMTYNIGDVLDLTGMVVTATYQDETTAPVTGYKVTGFDSSSAGQKTLTVSYTEGGITEVKTFNVTIQGE